MGVVTLCVTGGTLNTEEFKAFFFLSKSFFRLIRLAHQIAEIIPFGWPGTYLNFFGVVSPFYLMFRGR